MNKSMFSVVFDAVFDTQRVRRFLKSLFRKIFKNYVKTSLPFENFSGLKNDNDRKALECRSGTLYDL